MSTNQNKPMGRLLERLEEAGTIESLRPLLGEIEVLERADHGDENVDNLREQVFERLLRLARDEPDQARTVVLDDLLPLCLRRNEEWPASSNALALR